MAQTGFQEDKIINPLSTYALGEKPPKGLTSDPLTGGL